MSATSEELAAQAEQMLSAIGFFHTDERTGGGERQTIAPRPTVHTSVIPHFSAKAEAAGSKRRSGRTTNAKVIAMGEGRTPREGFSLDLKQGTAADARDTEFERF
jgi:hypothetical protein